MQLITHLLDLIFPISCVSCHQPSTYLCPNCISKLNFHPIQKCALCNKPSISGATHTRCQTPYAIDGIYSITAKSPIIMKFIKQLKYKFSYHIAISLKNLPLNLPLPITQADLLIPIPLHPRRQHWRGFNHAEKISQSISQSLKIPLNIQILVKTRHTQPQAAISHRPDRQQNLHHAFKLHPQANKNLIKNQHLVLIDDITTTGATLTQTAIPLKRAGAKSVWGLVLTR